MTEVPEVGSVWMRKLDGVRFKVVHVGYTGKYVDVANMGSSRVSTLTVVSLHKRYQSDNSFSETHSDKARQVVE